MLALPEGLAVCLQVPEFLTDVTETSALFSAAFWGIWRFLRGKRPLRVTTVQGRTTMQADDLLSHATRKPDALSNWFSSWGRSHNDELSVAFPCPVNYDESARGYPRDLQGSVVIVQRRVWSGAL